MNSLFSQLGPLSMFVLISWLLQVAVHLWATGEGTLSSCSLLVLHDLASFFGQESYENCLKGTYKAFISRCKIVDSTSLKHIEYIKASFIELCSIDMQKSVKVALASAQKLSLILKLGLQTKKVFGLLTIIGSKLYWFMPKRVFILVI